MYSLCLLFDADYRQLSIFPLGRFLFFPFIFGAPIFQRSFASATRNNAPVFAKAATKIGRLFGSAMPNTHFFLPKKRNLHYDAKNVDNM
jgi:hypothetical protein